MIQFKSDLHMCGFAYLPIHSVTALFPSDQDIDSLLRELSDVGVASESVEVFTGDEPVDVLNPKRWLHGVWTRYMRSMEGSVFDDLGALKRAEDVHLAGGRSLAVFVHDRDRDARQRIVAILKSHHGQDVVYWGGLHCEQL